MYGDTRFLLSGIYHCTMDVIAVHPFPSILWEKCWVDIDYLIRKGLQKGGETFTGTRRVQ
jgi:hypothetical protein